jgi:hypothetical protein
MDDSDHPKHAATPTGPQRDYFLTPEYGRFMNFFFFGAFAGSVAALYTANTIPYSFWPFSPEDLIRRSRLTADRIEFYNSFSDIQVRSYAVTLTVSIVLAPLLTVIHLIARLRMLTSPLYRDYLVSTSEWGARKLFTQLVAPIPACWFALWTFFFFVPPNFNPRYPGMATLFFWPNFPILAALGLCGLSLLIPLFVVNMIEVMKRLGGRDGRF